GDFCLVDFLPDGVPDLVPALDGICSKRGAEWQTLLIPESQSAMLESLKREGFSWWEQPEEPNLLVFSLPGDALAPGPGTG
ncbi:hypothetical protein JW921_02080, partial [Candidatus Fermentibacterales bacterium]|nr:hypothetical protein [Candidatus Fermentibacterales bacterium]